jgi:hypothetical protein
MKSGGVRSTDTSRQSFIRFIFHHKLATEPLGEGETGKIFNFRNYFPSRSCVVHVSLSFHHASDAPGLTMMFFMEKLQAFCTLNREGVGRAEEVIANDVENELEWHRDPRKPSRGGKGGGDER